MAELSAAGLLAVDAYEKQLRMERALDRARQRHVEALSRIPTGDMPEYYRRTTELRESADEDMAEPAFLLSPSAVGPRRTS